MGVGSCVGNFVSPRATWSYSKLWPALLGRHASPPPPSATPDDDDPTTRRWRAPDVVRDSHKRPLLEVTIPKRHAVLCNCRDANRRGIHVWPGLARAVASLGNHRLGVAIQLGLVDRAGHRERGA